MDDLFSRYADEQHPFTVVQSHYYEIVSRRERPYGRYDTAYEQCSCALETAAGRLADTLFDDGIPHPSDSVPDRHDGETIQLLATLESLGMLRARDPDTYTAVVYDLFQRDPKLYELRSRYCRVIVKTLEENVMRRLPDLLDHAFRRFNAPATGYTIWTVASWFGIGVMVAGTFYLGIDQLISTTPGRSSSNLEAPLDMPGTQGYAPTPYGLPYPVPVYPGPSPIPRHEPASPIQRSEPALPPTLMPPMRAPSRAAPIEPPAPTASPIDPGPLEAIPILPLEIEPAPDRSPQAQVLLTRNNR